MIFSGRKECVYMSLNDKLGTKEQKKRKEKKSLLIQER